MEDNKYNYLQDISIKKFNNSFSITTISEFDNCYFLSIQVQIEAIDNSGIGHLIEHLIIDRTYEVLKSNDKLGTNTHIHGATYPNYTIFYICSDSYVDFYSAIDAFLYIYSNLTECKNLYDVYKSNMYRDDPNSLISELEKRETSRISVIWQNFYSRCFHDTEYKFNSGGHSSAVYSKTFDEINDIWVNVSFKKADVVLSVPQFRKEIIDKLLELYHQKKTYIYSSPLKLDVIPINNNRYMTSLPNSFSYGIGLANKKRLRNDYWESLLFNSCIKNERVRRGIDYLYDNAAIYGMFYFGIHTTKKIDNIDPDDLFDMYFQILNDVDVDSLEATSKVLIDRLQLIDLDDKQKCIEIIARLMQRFRRDLPIDESMFKLTTESQLNGKDLKDGLINMLTDFRNDIDNKELLFCFQ